MSRQAHRRLGTNIYRDASGIRARVHVHGHTRQRRFAPGTPLELIRRWQDELRATLRAALPSVRRGTLADDVRRYLAAVAAMPTYGEREQHLQWWVERLGPTRHRALITAAEIREHLTSLSQGGLAPSTVNHYRTALLHLYNVLDGKAQPNPIRDVPRWQEPDPEPRGLPLETVRAILATMRPSVTRARLRVLASTGLPPSQLAALMPTQVDRERRLMWVPRRRKGRGVRAQMRPLTAEAVVAFEELDRAEGWGPCSCSALSRAFRRACRRYARQQAAQGLVVHLDGVRLYDLRHSWLSAAYAASGDLRAVQELAGHSSSRMTARYTLAAVPERMAKVVAKLDEAVPNESATPESEPASPCETVSARSSAG